MLVCEVTDGDTLTCSKELAEVRMPRSWGCGLCTYCHKVHHQSVNHLYCFAYHGSYWLLWIFWCCGLFSWNIKNLSGVNLYSFKICKSKVKGKWRLAFFTARDGARWCSGLPTTFKKGGLHLSLIFMNLTISKFTQSFEDVWSITRSQSQVVFCQTQPHREYFSHLHVKLENSGEVP